MTNLLANFDAPETMPYLSR